MRYQMNCKQRRRVANLILAKELLALYLIYYEASVLKNIMDSDVSYTEAQERVSDINALLQAGKLDMPHLKVDDILMTKTKMADLADRAIELKNRYDEQMKILVEEVAVDKAAAELLMKGLSESDYYRFQLIRCLNAPHWFLAIIGYEVEIIDKEELHKRLRYLIADAGRPSIKLREVLAFANSIVEDYRKAQRYLK